MSAAFVLCASWIWEMLIVEVSNCNIFVVILLKDGYCSHHVQMADGIPIQ